MMKKMTAILAVMMVILTMLSGAALADETVSAIGKATVQIQPDMARITLGVNATDAEVINAQQAVNEAMNSIVAALTDEEMAIASEDISTTSYFIYERYEYNSEKDVSERSGYVASASIAILVRDLSKAGKVIDVAMQAGANELNGVEFMSSDQTEARDRALTLAVQDGTRKAKTIAAAAGVQLSELPSSIEEMSDYYSYDTGNVVYATETSDAATGTQLQAGLLNLTATVEIVYEISK